MFEKVDLGNANFSESNLKKAIFKDVTFSKANFTGAFWINGLKCLSGSIGVCITDHVKNTVIKKECQKCSLPFAQLHKRDLVKLNVKGSNLEKANFSQSELTDAVFDESNLNQVSFVSANLAGASFKKASLNNVSFRDAVLTSTDFEGSDLTGSTWSTGELCNTGSIGTCLTDTIKDVLANKGCQKCKLQFANFSNTKMQWFDLKESVFYGANFKKANLVGAFLRNADLRFANLSGANLSSAELTGARLTDTNLKDTRLTGATWTNGKVCLKGSIGKCLQ